MYVTFRKEGVDWNISVTRKGIHHDVTFRKEGVDWNLNRSKNLEHPISHLPQGRCGLKSVNWIMMRKTPVVTFRKEGVDWNLHWNGTNKESCLRHLPQGRCGLKLIWLMLLPDLVSHLPQGRCGLKSNGKSLYDTNMKSPSARKVWIEILSWKDKAREFKSPSARKVWIEIGWNIHQPPGDTVTFRKEGVDWNTVKTKLKIAVKSHLPQGRCGLKFSVSRQARLHTSHLPQGRCGLKYLIHVVTITTNRHLPQGRCGLKFLPLCNSLG